MIVDDFLYLDDGKVKVTETGMQIPEFKKFLQYDRSDNKTFFKAAMSYIFYVYKIYGDIENRSCYHLLPLHQRKIQTVKHYTSKWNKISDFDENTYVLDCINAYLNLSRTQSEKVFDALKTDLDEFINFVSTIPHAYKKTVTVYKKEPTEVEGEFIERGYPVEVEVANTKERLEAIKQAKDLSDLYKRNLADVMKDQKEKKAQSRMFENPNEVKRISIDSNNIPMSDK